MTVSTTKYICDSGGMAYAPVLGTGTERFVGSNPTCRTKENSVTLAKKITEKNDKSVYSSVYDMILLSTFRKEKVAVVLTKNSFTGLRNYRPFSIVAQVNANVEFACAFLKNQPVHLCGSSVDNRRQTPVDRHLCSVKLGKCSHYVYRKSQSK